MSRKLDDGRTRVSQTCIAPVVREEGPALCGRTISSYRAGPPPRLCVDHLEHGEDYARVRRGMAERVIEQDRIADGEPPTRGSLFMRDALAMAGDSDEEPLSLIRLARKIEAPVPLVAKVLEAAQVRAYVRPGSRGRAGQVLVVDKSGALDACMTLAAEALAERRDGMARKASEWHHLTQDEFMEVVRRVGSKPKLAKALGCGVSSIYGWIKNGTAPPAPVQQRLVRLLGGATLTEVANPEPKVAVTVPQRAANWQAPAKVHQPLPPEDDEDDDQDESWEGEESPGDDRDDAVQALRDTGRQARRAMGATIRAAAGFLGRMAARVDA